MVSVVFYKHAGNFVEVNQFFIRTAHWYEFHTRQKIEKKVYRQLLAEKIPALLVMESILRHCSERIRLVFQLLHWCYVSVNTNFIHHIQVLQLNGAVCLVRCSGKPQHMPEFNIAASSRNSEHKNCAGVALSGFFNNPENLRGIWKG